MEATVDEKYTCRNIDVVEVKVETHDYQIKSLFKTQKNINERLTAIELTLKRIWWTAFGALGFFIISEIGLLKALKFIS
jgi:hypothetical protein